MKEIYLDFEFNRVNSPNVNLVFCAAYDEDRGIKKGFWLHKNFDGKKELIEFLKQYDRVIAFSAVAEVRSFLALLLRPLEWEWIDLFLEYRLISNSNNNIQYGWQLVDGKEKYFKSVGRYERKKGEGFKQTHSLAEATYKMLQVIVDTEHKTKMRDLIISDPEKFTPEEQEAISLYGLSDVEYLPRLRRAIFREIRRLCTSDEEMENFKNDVFEDYFYEYEANALWRGRYSVHTAIMESHGYPIDVDKVKNFSNKVSTIMFEVQREINSLFPEIEPFRWNKKEGRFSLRQSKLREFIESTPYAAEWERTPGEDYSYALEAWTKFYDFKHTYPEDNFGAQMVRFLKLKQTIYGFSEKKKGKKNFWDSVGPDGRVRPYTNHFGSQTSRSQPASTGFLFLKPAWMRALCVPAKGKAIAGIDYVSEEYLLQGLVSCDPNMIEAYLSGDVYMDYGIRSNLVPPDATKKTHGPQRDGFKSTVLGLGFKMSKIGLAVKLTQDTGRVWTEDEAQQMIDAFNEAYPDYYAMGPELVGEYQSWGALFLEDGWALWGDNENMRSVQNFPIQGRGGMIMRKAVDLAVSYGCKVIMTLHDALYIEYNVGEEHKVELLDKAMREAFVWAFGDFGQPVDPEDYKFPFQQRYSKIIKMDPFAWSPEYEKDSEILLPSGYTIPCSNLYVDERSIIDYEKFSPYFNASTEDEL